MTQQVHGLAASIRSAKDHFVVDLAGQSPDTIRGTIRDAFREPFSNDLTEMIRITLITGAGKQARQKYHEHAHKAVVTALQEVGYKHDQTASAVTECAGLYKLQHDTNKNLKTVVVFPLLDTKHNAGGDTEEKEEEPILPENSPGYKLAVASMPTFQSIISSQCPSWSQKRGCLECLDAVSDYIQSFDDKLMHGQPLSPAEQSLYNVVSQLEEKKARVRHLSKEQVEQGRITSDEKELLLQHNAQRLEEQGLADPAKAKLMQRKQLLQSIKPISPAKFKHHAAISKLQTELVKLGNVKDDNKLLTIQERQKVTRRDRILEEISDLQDASRGWFESDEAFTVRVHASQEGLGKVLSNKPKNSAGARRATTTANARRGATNTGGSKWILPSEQKGGKTKKVSRGTGPSVFDAMRIKQQQLVDDDDSSSENDNHEPSTAATTTTTTNASSKTDSSAAKRKKSKKKKNKKNASNKTDTDDNAFLEAASRKVAEEQQKAKEAEEQNNNMTIVGQLWRFLRTYVFPVILALIGWLVRLVFGKPKTKSKKN